MKQGKAIIFSAPSGSGKSTIIGRLMQEHPELRLEFSISCTSRPPRGGERHGVEYFFISPDEFRERAARGEFIEYEEVYPGRFYGTLRSQVESRMACGRNVVLDIDVAGGCRVKEAFGAAALSVFIQPPSVEELRKRLESRASDSPEAIATRIAKAEHEMSFAGKYDIVIVNDNLDEACRQAYEALKAFTGL